MCTQSTALTKRNASVIRSASDRRSNLGRVSEPAIIRLRLTSAEGEPRSTVHFDLGGLAQLLGALNTCAHNIEQGSKLPDGTTMQGASAIVFAESGEFMELAWTFGDDFGSFEIPHPPPSPGAS